jgi:hypothetical protein
MARPSAATCSVANPRLQTVTVVAPGLLAQLPAAQISQALVASPIH